MGKKLYIVEGTFSAIVEGTSEEDAKASFTYRILSIEEKEDVEMQTQSIVPFQDLESIFLKSSKSGE